MAPKLPDKEPTDGRNGKDKNDFKGDWGSHKKADLVAEEMEPTEEQLKNAQAVINSQWSLSE